MPVSGTAYTKDDDYTLNVTREYFDAGHHSRSITRLFNFRAQQVTTISREWISLGAGVTSTQQMNIQNFGDIQSQDEIAAMREKLVELGGQPPELDKTPGKQALRQPAA